MYRGHEGDDNGQSIRAIGSALHLAYQQAAGAPDVALSSSTSASPGNQQPIHVIGFSLHLVHAAYAIGASHQVAGAPDVGKPTPHPDRGHRRRCDHFRCYRCLQRRQSGVQLVQPQLESATDASCIDARSILVSTAAVIAHQQQL